MKYCTLFLFALLSCSACEERTDEMLFARLAVRLVMPDNRPVERFETLADISYLENLNTKERIHFPAFDGNSAEVTLQKGVYTLILEGYVHYADGSQAYVRNADYNEPAKAQVWMDDSHSLALLLQYVN